MFNLEISLIALTPSITSSPDPFNAAFTMPTGVFFASVWNQESSSNAPLVFGSVARRVISLANTPIANAVLFLITDSSKLGSFVISCIIFIPSLINADAPFNVPITMPTGVSPGLLCHNDSSLNAGFTSPFSFTANE